MNKIILTLTILSLATAAASPVAAQRKTKTPATKANTESRFMDIEFSVPAVAPETAVYVEPVKDRRPMAEGATTNESASVEQATALQLKYALLLNDNVEHIANLNLFALIDEWLGTRYRMGGETKSGIDCSAFTKMLYATLFGFALPRTAREQHEASTPVADNDLKEGDLLFFNTRGGVSHVGMYLQNGKFVHASSSSGVTISDLSEGYWSNRYLGGRRPLNAAIASAKP